jgi:hypothetical protein
MHATADFETFFSSRYFDSMQSTALRAAISDQNGKLNIKEYLMLNSTDGRTDGRQDITHVHLVKKLSEKVCKIARPNIHTVT